MDEKRTLQSIPDDELLHRLTELMGQSRHVEADIVAHIAEVDERRLYARAAFPSMFAYCTAVLHLSEAEAYLRISAARASRKHPMLLPMLADGRLHLTAIERLAPHLTHESRDGLLERAAYRSKCQIEELIAEIAPRPDVATVVRKLPERKMPRTAGLPAVPNREEGPMLELGPDPTRQLRPDGVAAPDPGLRPDVVGVSHDAFHTPAVAGAARVAAVAVSAPPAPPFVIQPLSPGRYKVQFTAGAELHDKLERLRALMGARDLAAIIEQAVTEKLERLEARRFAQTRAPRKGLAEADTGLGETHTELGPSPSSRHIPAAVRRAVRERDGDRCRFADEQGRRCPERNQLEFHHRYPFGLGGDHSVANVSLLCRAHNAYLAECDFGGTAMAGHRRVRSRASGATAG